MTKYEIVDKILKKIDELEIEPVEKIEENEKGSLMEAYKRGRNNGITEGLLIACTIISSLDI